jgi:4-azaleucine resistance transporter AzlC
MDLGASRRRLIQDSLGIMVSAGGFGLVYGLSARAAGFSPIEASAMSLFVFAGASQFVAVGYVLGGFSWVAVVLLTAFINARHFLYGAALAPYLADQPKPLRAAMAHVLTDEAFALAIAHFRRIGRADVRGYWLGAILSTFIPWNVATLVGVTIGGSIPEPGRFGLDVIFPAAMGGLAVGLITGRRELVAALAGAIIAVAISVTWDPAAGIILGGVIGPLVGMAVPAAGDDRVREGLLAFGPEPRDPADEPLIPFFPATIERLGRHPGDVAASDRGDGRPEPAGGSIEPDADRP